MKQPRNLRQLISLSGGPGSPPLSERSDSRTSGSNIDRISSKPIEINTEEELCSVEFLDEKHIVSGTFTGKIQCWRVEDGAQAGPTIRAGGNIHSIAVTKDGEWIASGSENGQLVVWSAVNGQRVIGIGAHSKPVRAVDFSEDKKRIATGSDDKTVCTWSISASKRRLIGPLEHDAELGAVKFSPDGMLIATATWMRPSVRIYQNGNSRKGVSMPLFFSFDIPLPNNQALVWAHDSKQLFVLSHNGRIISLDASNGAILSAWCIHSSNGPRSIALSSDGVFIAATAGSTVSLWNTATRQQVGSLISENYRTSSMAISANQGIVTTGGGRITLRTFSAFFPPPVPDNVVLREHEAKLEKNPPEYDVLRSVSPLRGVNEDTIRSLRVELDARDEMINALRADLHAHSDTVKTLRAREESSKSQIVHLTKLVQELRDELAVCPRTADQQRNSTDETMTGLRPGEEGAKHNISHFERTIEDLSVQLADSRRQVHALQWIIRSAHEQKHHCEDLYAQDRVYDASRDLLRIAGTSSEGLGSNPLFMDWLAEFTLRCSRTLENMGDEALDVKKHDEAVQAYSTALTLIPSPSDLVLTKWAKAVSVHGSVHESLSAAAEFKAPGYRAYHAICDVLEGADRVTEAIECFRRMKVQAPEDTSPRDKEMEWELDFQRRCVRKLEKLGDTAMDSCNPDAADEAMKAYSTALLFSPSCWKDVLTKWVRIATSRGRTHAALNAATKFELPVFEIYRTFCDVLQRDGHVMDAIICFRRMQIALRQDTTYPEEWAIWELDFRCRCVSELVKLGDAAMASNSYKTAIGYYANTLSLEPANKKEILVQCCKARARSLEEELSRANEDISHDPSSYQGYKKKHAVLHRMTRYREAFNTYEMMLSTIDRSPDLDTRKIRQQFVDATPTIRQHVQKAIVHLPRILVNTSTGRLYDKVGQAAMFERLLVFDELRSSMTTWIDEARIDKEVKKYYRYVMLSHKWEEGEPLFQAVEHLSIFALELSSANIKLQTFCKLARSLGFEWVWSDTCCIDKKDNVVLQESLVAMFTWYRGSSLTIIYLRGVSSQNQKSGALRRSIWNTRAWTYQEYVAAETVQFYTEDWKPYLGLTRYNHKESPEIVLEMQQATGALTQQLCVIQPDLGRVREKLHVASRRHTTIMEDAAYSLLGIFNASIPVIYGEGNRAVGRLLDHVLTGSRDISILAWTGRAGNYNSCLPMDLTVYDQVVPPHIPEPIEMEKMNEMVVALTTSLPDHSQAKALYQTLCALPPPFFAASRLQLSGITFPITEIVLVPVAGSDSGGRVYHASVDMIGDVEIKTKDNLLGTDDLFLFHPWIGPLLWQDNSRRGTKADLVARALRLVVRLRQQFGALMFAPVWGDRYVQYKRVATDSLIMVRVLEGASLLELTDNVVTIDVQ